MKPWRIEGKEGLWEVVVGMEVHAQISSRSKLFSGASAQYGGKPNEQVSLVDAAFPGTLPVINAECVAQAVRTGLGLKAKINLFSQFDRKNYFYADLPSGYQISQFYHPIVGEGKVAIELSDGERREIGVTRLHLEQDAGKSIHDQNPDKTLIDLNRAGVALMEIVSEPDIRSPEEAGAYLRHLRQIVRYLGTCDGNMEEGSMRADVNVSVRRMGEEGYRTRCEVKNVNSIRFVMQAVEAEARRQVDVYENGEEVSQETRTFDTVKGETRALRSKEEATDYRYFPDPDLLPVRFDADFVEALRQALPELPEAKRKRLEETYGVNAYESGILTTEAHIADFYENLAKSHDPRLCVNWMLGDFFALLNRKGESLENSSITAEKLGELLGLIEDKTINGKIAKEILEEMGESGERAGEIVERKGLKQVTDVGPIREAAAEVLANNADKVAEYKSGKEKLFGFFVGQIMKKMAGKANPAVVNEALRQMLAE